MINSRAIEDLDPIARQVCRKHIELCAAEDIELLITSTYRDEEQQNALFAKGRSAKGKVVTWARGGESWHNFRSAWDAIPLVNGKADWTIEDSEFLRMIALGIEAGAEAGHYWPHPTEDHDHFQYRPLVVSLPEARLRFARTGSIFA